MHVGFVSDERYVAIPDVLCEFISPDGTSYETRSRARGAIYIDIPEGSYNVTLYKQGYGSKSIDTKLKDSISVVFDVNRGHFFNIGNGNIL